MARCPTCGGIVATGPQCLVEDNDWFTWDGDGTKDDPHRLVPVLDPDADQLLECTGEGLLAPLPDVIANPPYCKVYNSTNLSIPDDTLTPITFNLEQIDTDGMHDDTVNTSRLIFQTAGFYTVTVNATWDKSDEGDRMIWIYKNGSDIIAHDSKRHGGADLYVGHSLEQDDYFDEDDYVEAFVQQTSGGALFIITEDFSPNFSASYT